MASLQIPLAEQEEAGVRLSGQFEDMTNSEYHSSKALSGSNTGYMLTAPALYEYRRNNPEDPTPAMEDGSALHALVLEPERGLVPKMPAKYNNPEGPERPKLADGRAKAGTPEKEAFARWSPLEKAWKAGNAARKLERDAWTSSQSPDAIMLPQVRREKMQGAADALLANPDVVRLDLFKGLKECSFFWTCEETGAYVRIKPDVFDPESGIIVDVKKSLSAEENYFKRSAGKLGYFRSAAMQIDILEQMGHKVNGFVYAVVEPEAPHLTQLFEYDDADLDQGRREWKVAARRWVTCTESGVWPGYSGGIAMLTVPPYLRDQDYMA